MEKFKDLLPKGLLVAFLVKMLLNTTSYSDMGIVFCLAGTVALQVYLEKSKSIQDLQEAVFKKSQEQNDVINKQNDVIAQFAVEFSKMKNEVAGVKLRSDFQQNGLNGGLGKARSA